MTQDLRQAYYQILHIFLLKEVIKINVNMDMIGEKCETCGIKYKYCKYYLDYTNIKDDLIAYKCLCCNNNYQSWKKKISQ